MKTEDVPHSQRIISGIQVDVIRIMVRLRMALLILRNYKNPVKSLKILKTLTRHRREFSGEKIKKIVRVDGKYYWDLYLPGYKSVPIMNFFEGEANRISSTGKNTARFNNVLIAITKRCPLKCEHCFEWDVLNGKETLTLAQIKDIVRKFQEKGTGQIQLTGGEPLLRVNDIIEILESSKPGTEFWIFTSGDNLTPENAKKLKIAGLTGAVISLDHFDPDIHNQFRGSGKSFGWVQEAVRNSIAAGLVTALSICATKSFVTESNLMAYLELAKEMGVSFIQVLEPKAVGHYSGKDVSLNAGQEKILEDFYLKMNYCKQFRKYPILYYHGYYQRKVGCFGSGNRSLYVDTDGDLHACPFCREKTGNALSGDLDDAIGQLVLHGCHRYKTATF
jgi:MoaA/NifB/PqqE/SkfB family radical SAM enzyme